MSSSDSDTESEPDLPGMTTTARPNLALPLRNRKLTLDSSSSDGDTAAAPPATQKKLNSLPTLGVTGAASAPSKSVQQAAPPQQRAESTVKNGAQPNPPAAAADTTSDIDYQEEDITEQDEESHGEPAARQQSKQHVPLRPSTSEPQPPSMPASVVAPAALNESRPVAVGQPPQHSQAPAASPPLHHPLVESSPPQQFTGPTPSAASPAQPDRPKRQPPGLPSPLARAASPSDDGDDALVSKAFARIERRSGSSRPGSRAATPTRQQLSVPRAASQQQPPPPPPVAAGQTSSLTQLAMVEASRDRLLRENVRLSDELAWINKEYEKHRGAAERLVILERQHALLETEIAVSRRALAEADREAARNKSQLEAKLRAAMEHNAQLTSELQTAHAAITQFEARLAEKDRTIAAEASISMSLRADLRDMSTELKRFREDAAQRHEEDQSRIEQVSAVLAEAKKQRIVLLDLNDKFSREKEAADAERRRALEELRTLQSSLDAVHAKHTREVEELRKENDHLRGAHAQKDELSTQEHAKLRDANDRLERQRAQLQQRLDEAISSHKAALEDAVSHQKSQIAELRYQLDELTTQKESLSHRLDEAESRCAQLAKQRDDATAEGHRAAQSELQWELQLAQRRAKDLEEELSESRRRLSDTVQQLEQATEQRLTAEEQHAKASARLASVRDAMERLLSSDDQLSEENERLLRRVAELETAVERLEHEARGAGLHAAHAQELQIENERLAAAVSRVTADRDELSRELERLHAELRASFKPGDGAAQRSVSVPRSNRDFVF